MKSLSNWDKEMNPQRWHDLQDVKSTPFSAETVQNAIAVQTSWNINMAAGVRQRGRSRQLSLSRFLKMDGKGKKM